MNGATAPTAFRAMGAETMTERPAPCTTVEAVRADLHRRAEFGMAKYGQSVADNPLSLREWLNHVYEETLDKAVYLKRAIEELDRKP